jgi:hypothetical protein
LVELADLAVQLETVVTAEPAFTTSAVTAEPAATLMAAMAGTVTMVIKLK